MPKPYNYAQLYKRSENRTETEQSADLADLDSEPGQSTVPVASDLTYEGYCAALGIDVGKARSASLVSSLAAKLADCPIARAAKDWGDRDRSDRQALRPHCVNTLAVSRGRSGR